ncbi:hypothetical protein NHH03_15860 [Stieleria sp. TO1_6]|uniref:hypothetical protein n=1 Tax=Stieleria tagensis TaxID=2956795 RepID=UPI00209B0EBB|nr:hypothetical protein [Stieleria tagensis]MCO8123224.1 hypothetical protein [Stieleria tagensis]
MFKSRRRLAKRPSVIPTWQSLPREAGCGEIARRIASTTAAALSIWCCLVSGIARAELFDSLEAYPPRWQLDTSDCDARVTDHKNLVSGGADGGGCESITFEAGIGSESILIYPVEPVHAVDDLVGNLSVMSARKGARVGFRIRFPYVRDSQTRRPVAVVIYGATYDQPGKFQSIGVGSIERPLRIKMAKMRAQYGSSANVADPYVDAIAINAYSGPGTTTLRLDNLSLRGMVAVGDHGRVEQVPTAPPTAMRRELLGRPSLGQSDSQDIAGIDASSAPPFSQTELIRILEHRGEPLTWVRSLGFDAVLLSRPPTASLLRDAIRSQLLVYAPPPIAPDPALQTLLDPVAAWYLGGGVALDNDRVSQTDLTVRRLRQFPAAWRRPIIIAPTESWREYSAIADAVVLDAAPRSRGLPASEQTLAMTQRQQRMGSDRKMAVAIQSSSPPSLSTMNQGIEAAIGSPPGGTFHWHSMFTQTLQALEHAPRAIVYRSHESLVSGSMFSHQRSMALSYVNRFVAMLSPWVTAASPAPAYPITGAAYRCGRLESGGDEFLLLSSDQSIGDEVLAGDGRAIEIILPPGHVRRTAWRLTDFSAQRIAIEAHETGSRIQIVSPDVAEVIVISGDASLGARLDQSARRFANQAAADRWQLCGDQLRYTQAAWDQAVSSGATESIVPIDIMTAAQRTLDDAEPLYRSGDAEACLRLSRRADAWSIRAAFQLSQALRLAPSGRTPAGMDVSSWVSIPPIDEGRPMLQTAWHPLMQDEGWSQNLIATGGLDQPSVLAPENWSFGRRKLSRAASSASWVSRGFFSGQGAVKMSAASTTSQPLGGGYEGTIAILSSPRVKIEPGQAVRVDAMVRTIGFGSPHQGVLVYDTLGGQEMGVLVRGVPDWTPVRLYRQNLTDSTMQVMFEVIGDGEVVIDEISVKIWAPQPLPELPLRPLSN